jgi:anti-sigma factor RsiW
MSRHLEADLVAYVQGEVSQHERTRADRHLAECAACAATLASHRELLEALAASADLAPTVRWEAYRGQLRGKLQSRLDGPAVWRRWRVALVPVTAVAAVGLLLVAMHGTERRSERRELAAVEETAIGRELQLMRDAPVVEHLDLLEDLEVIRHLDRVEPDSDG